MKEAIKPLRSHNTFLCVQQRRQRRVPRLARQPSRAIAVRAVSQQQESTLRLTVQRRQRQRGVAFVVHRVDALRRRAKEPRHCRCVPVRSGLVQRRMPRTITGVPVPSQRVQPRAHGRGTAHRCPVSGVTTKRVAPSHVAAGGAREVPAYVQVVPPRGEVQWSGAVKRLHIRHERRAFEKPSNHRQVTVARSPVQRAASVFRRGRGRRAQREQQLTAAQVACTRGPKQRGAAVPVNARRRVPPACVELLQRIVVAGASSRQARVQGA